MQFGNNFKPLKNIVKSLGNETNIIGELVLNKKFTTNKYNLRIDKEETRQWTLSRNGEFSVKSCMSLFGDDGIGVGSWKMLWSLKVPSKVVLFMDCM